MKNFESYMREFFMRFLKSFPLVVKEIFCQPRCPKKSIEETLANDFHKVGIDMQNAVDKFLKENPEIAKKSGRKSL